MKTKYLYLVGVSGLLFSTGVNAQQTPTAKDESQVQKTSEEGVLGQEADQSAEPTESQETIVVTGSRIRGTFSSPTPVTSLNQETLLAAAPSNLADGLKQLPSIAPGGGPTAGGGTRNGGVNTLNMRGLGADRTLTLLDGRRLTPIDASFTIDSNLIPQQLVQRVDVVTGGASAAYGSDAVAGVVNFILDTNFTGLKVSGSSGISQRGDNSEQKFSVAAGAGLLDNRLHIIASGEWTHNKGVRGDAREFRVTALNQLQNPAGTPALIRGTDLRTPYTPGGLVVIGGGGTTANNFLIKGIMFGEGGVPLPYDYGTISSDIGITNGSQNGGDGLHVSTGQEIVRPLDRRGVFGHLKFDVTDNVSLFGEASYNYAMSDFNSSPVTRTVTIQRSNPYLQQAAPALVAQMTALGVTRFSLNRVFTEQRQNHTANKNETTRFLAGLTGNFGSNWTWEASYQKGRNENDYPMYNNAIIANLNRAVNAVTSGGQIVCADTVSANAATREAAAGCQPFNPFGYNSPSAAAIAYVFGTSLANTVVKQQVADANISGTLFNLPAGPAQIAFGGEWRKISALTTSDELSQAGGFRLVNQQPFFGEYNVKEGFAELQLPILHDAPIAQRLDLNLAARHTDYSTSGKVNTWKIGVDWEITNGLRLRGTRSRDIRAPNLEDLFATGRQNNITVDDTLKTGKSYFSVPNKTLGNPDLKPEIANTLVAGAVFQPSFIPSFSLAVDYYDIKIRNAIQNVGGNNANTQCNLSNGTSPLCAFITRDPTTQAVIGTLTSPANLAEQVVRGVDFEGSYRVPFEEMFGENAGSLRARLLATYVAKNETTSPLLAQIVNDAGNGTPHWRSNLQLNYDRGAFSAFTQFRYIGSFTWDKTRVLGVDTDFNHVKAAAYVDAQFSVRVSEFGHDQTIFLNIANLLDKKPTYDPSTGGATPLPTDTGLYDQVGRMFRVGVRLEF